MPSGQPQYAKTLARLNDVLATAADSSAGRFARWLAESMRRDGRPAGTLSLAANLSAPTVGYVLRHPDKVPEERTIRCLAVALGADPDVIARLAGYDHDLLPAPHPGLFDALTDWIRAALAARGESVLAASLNAGLSKNALSEVLKHGRCSRPTADKLEIYFGVAPGSVRGRFVSKHPNRVASGKEVAALRGLDEIRALAARGRAKAAEALTPEKRRAIGRIAGAASMQRRGRAAVRAFSQAGQAARRAQAEQRGSWFADDAARARHVDRARVAGRLGAQARLEREGGDAVAAHLKPIAVAKKNGEWVECVFCDGANGLPIYRTPSQRTRGRAMFHRACYKEWRRDPQMRDRSRVWGTLGQMRERVIRSGDAKLLERIDEQIAAELRQMYNPRAADKPPELLRKHRPLALELGRLHYEEGVPAEALHRIVPDLGWRVQLPTRKDAHGKHRAGSTTYELLRLYRALKGQKPRKPGPNRGA
jgi:lambda repressor-like predicted transcriptional regulator